MKRDNLEQIWPDISEKLRTRFPKLTEADVTYIKGYDEELLTRIETRIGKTRLAVITLVDSL